MLCPIIDAYSLTSDFLDNVGNLNFRYMRLLNSDKLSTPYRETTTHCILCFFKYGHSVWFI